MNITMESIKNYLNRLKNAPVIKKAPGVSDSVYFQKLWETIDTEIRDQDEADVKVNKMEIKLSRMNAVRESINSKGFKILEEALLNRIYFINNNLIWDALKQGDKVLINNLRIEQSGIISLFELFSSIGTDIETLRKDLFDLKQSHKIVGVVDLAGGG